MKKAIVKQKFFIYSIKKSIVVRNNTPDLVVLLLNEEIEDISWLSVVMMEDFSLKFTNDRFTREGGVSKSVNPLGLIMDYLIQSPF